MGIGTGLRAEVDGAPHLAGGPDSRSLDWNVRVSLEGAIIIVERPDLRSVCLRPACLHIDLHGSSCHVSLTHSIIHLQMHAAGAEIKMPDCSAQRHSSRRPRGARTRACGCCACRAAPKRLTGGEARREERQRARQDATVPAALPNKAKRAAAV